MTSAPPEHRVRPRFDRVFPIVCGCFGLFIVVLIAGIFTELVLTALPSIRQFGLSFLVNRTWDPLNTQFGAASSIYGTLVTTAIALVVAVPLSFAISLFLVELAPPRISQLVSVSIMLLASIPSIIYGMWGLYVLAPFVSDHIQIPLIHRFGRIDLFSGPPMGIGILTTGIILALMILPFISAVMRDVMLMVPSAVKESLYSTGATMAEVTWHISMRYCLHGFMGGFILGLGRAIGETMAVTFIIGNTHSISTSLFDAGSSITSTLANEFTEAADSPLYVSALMELGLVLFFISFGVQVVYQLWMYRVRKHMKGTV